MSASSARPYRHLCPEADMRDAMSKGSFWTQAEWAGWSNRLAALIPDDDIGRYANPEGAQESIIVAVLSAYIAERAGRSNVEGAS